MEKFGLILTKVLTALTTIGCLFLFGWSLITGQLAILTVVSFLLSCVMGFFTYIDIKNTFFLPKK